MTNLLILVPQKPNLHPKLKQITRDNLARLDGLNPTLNLEIVVDERGKGDAGIRTLSERVQHTSTIRQGMIDDYLKPYHDFVMWIDADIVRYSPELPTQLIEQGKGNVAAPMIYLEGRERRFYDIAGFVEQGKWATTSFPFFKQPGPVVSLDGVGCVYVVPARVYEEAKHIDVPGFTDHLAVCRAAKKMGFQCLAFRNLIAWHADLTHFGEQYH